MRTLSSWLRAGFFAFLTGGICTASLAQDTSLNPLFSYFVNGSTANHWGLTVGDNENWSTGLQQLSGKSKGSQVEAFASTYKGVNDAIRLKWSRKKGQGQFAIYGETIDLSAVEDLVALTFEVKVLRKPKAGVTLAMDCGYPCRGTISLQGMLRKLPSDEWVTVPIPLNCFTAKGLDASKINGPFVLSTEKKFEIEIANIRMERLPEGTPTCK